MRVLRAITVAILLGFAADAPAQVTLANAYIDTIAWLESHQNADGSWGDDSTAPVITAEALLALARAGRAQAPAAQRAITWLRNQHFPSIDYRARAIRALEAAGVDMTDDGLALRILAPSFVVGYGPASRVGVTGYDTALALGALEATDTPLVTQAAGIAVVASRAFQFQATGGGQTLNFAVWHGEQIQLGSAEILPAIADGTLNVAITAEVIRAMDQLENDPSWSVRREQGCASLTALLFPIDPTPAGTLDVALRLAALNEACSLGSAPTLESALLDTSRFTAPVAAPGGRLVRYWASDDPLVHAIGLLAVRTSPNFTAPTAGNIDGDAEPDASDAFPFDPFFTDDQDGDGIPDQNDGDRDGDGVADGADLYPDDAKEWANADGDSGTGAGQGPDNRDNDDDNDGVLDADEVAQGSNPYDANSDDDPYADGADACPTDPDGGSLDSDGDGTCNLADDCPDDPFEVADRDGDDLCDGQDPDDDGDGWLDGEEIAVGTDPWEASSNPETALQADPSGDADRDGLVNATELAALPTGTDTSPLRADTDDDGATDGYEVGVGTNPRDAASQPPPVIAVFGAIGTPNAAGPVRHTLTAGQGTPAGRADAFSPPLQDPAAVNLSGFQPQTTLGRDLDGDGLGFRAENDQRTSNVRVDTDGDRFVDGAGNQVLAADHPGLQLYNLDGTPDPYADGEADVDTDPADESDHPGEPGDVAPLFHPDGQVTAGDGALLLRIVADPAVAEDADSQNEAITRIAADANEDSEVRADDALKVLRAVGELP